MFAVCLPTHPNGPYPKIFIGWISNYGELCHKKLSLLSDPQFYIMSRGTENKHMFLVPRKSSELKSISVPLKNLKIKLVSLFLKHNIPGNKGWLNVPNHRTSVPKTSNIFSSPHIVKTWFFNWRQKKLSWGFNHC